MDMVDLIWLGKEPFEGKWPLGRVWKQVLMTPQAIHQFVQEHLADSQAAAWLFWDGILGVPDPNQIAKTLALAGDVWHAGLRLGMGGLPNFLNYVEPTWMFNLDPPSDRVATSWRISLRACLVRKGVLQQLGDVDAGFETLSGAALEMGCRFIKNGAFVRHVPELLTSVVLEYPKPVLPIYDELRFIRRYFGWRWVRWAVLRAALNRGLLPGLWPAYQKLRRASFNPSPAFYKRETPEVLFDPGEWHDKVTVLIPTLERYPYLRVELEQLRHQTVRPLEIMIMDQTPAGERDTSLPSEFADLPLRVFYQDTMGQCTGWNQGLLASRGDFILFLGDDADRIAPDFLERFLRAFRTWDADMVACIVDEVGADPVPEHLAIMRIADGFPIAMVRRSLFLKSGLMDYAFDRGARADQDLGIRCYLAGGLMIVDPAIRVLHHHAPRGGLRKHKARVITYAKSRRSLWARNLAGVTEIYLVRRYFTNQQQTEHKWLDVLGTFSIRGGLARKFFKILVSGILLLNTLSQLRQREQQAQTMMNTYPHIPILPTSNGQT